MGWNSKPEETIEQGEVFSIIPSRTESNQVRPWAIYYGLHRASSQYLTDLFNSRTEPITQEIQTGKSSTEDRQTGTNYFSSFAGGIGYGENFNLRAILKSEQVRWEGDLSSADGTAFWTLDITENVPITLYTGRQDGTNMRGGGLADVELETHHGGVHPPYRHLIYFVFDQLLFGTSNQPPNYQFIFQCVTKSLVLDPANTSGDPDQDADSYHLVNGGQLPPEIIYDLRTNPIWGQGKDASIFDEASFISACDRLRAEGMGIALKVDRRKTIDSIVKDLLNFCHGEINEVDGKLTFRLKRGDDPAIPIPETAFLDDPAITPGSWHDRSIINEARVTYATLEDYLQQTTAVFYDESSVAVSGVRSRTFSNFQLRDKALAERLANDLVKNFGSPEVGVSLSLDHTYDRLLKGDLIAPVFPRYGLDGSVRVRVTEVTISAPGKGGVTIKGYVDKLAVPRDAGVSDDAYAVQNLEAQPIDFRLAFLTSSQKEGFQDGYVLAGARGNAVDDRMIIHHGWDGSTYNGVQSTPNFSLGLEVHEWRDFGDGRVVVEFSFLTPWDETSFINAQGDTAPDWHLLSGTHDGTTETIDPKWSVVRSGSAVQVLGGGRYAMTFESGQFGSVPYAFPSSCPTVRAYLAPLSGFPMVRTNQFYFERAGGNAPGDGAEVRRVRAQSSLLGTPQDFSDATEEVYDRPAETLTQNWGGHAPHGFDYSISAVGVTGAAPLTTQIDLNGSEDADYSIDWGDGSPQETGSNQAMPATLSHVYTTPGTYQATLSVTPANGGAMQSFPVAVVVS